MDGSDDQSLVDGLDHELVGAGSLRTPPGTSSAILSAIDSALGAIDTPRPRDDDEDDAARASSRFPEPGGPPPPPVELPNRPSRTAEDLLDLAAGDAAPDLLTLAGL